MLPAIEACEARRLAWVSSHQLSNSATVPPPFAEGSASSPSRCRSDWSCSSSARRCAEALVFGVAARALRTPAASTHLASHLPREFFGSTPPYWPSLRGSRGVIGSALAPWGCAVAN